MNENCFLRQPYFIPMLSAILVWGCTTTRTISSTSPLGEYPYEDFHNEVGVSQATLTLKNGVSFEGSHFRLERDSVYWEGVDSSYSMPMRDVQQIIGANHYRGGIEWLGLGFVVGAVAGTYAALLNDDALYFYGGAIVFPVVTGTAGAIVGHTFTYDFDITD